jgi:hypothetical protein
MSETFDSAGLIFTVGDLKFILSPAPTILR